MRGIGEARRRFRAPALEPGDLVLALGLLALAVAEIISLPDLPRHPLVLFMALLMTVPLLARRRVPVLVLAVSMGAFALQTALGVPVNAQLAPLAAVLVACYSVGVHAVGRAAVGGLALGLLLGMATVPTVEGYGASDFAFVGIVVGGSWGVGRLVRSRSAEARAEQARAQRLALQAEAAAREAVEAERRRIARELHDIISHNLSLMVLQAGAAEQVVRATPERAIDPLRIIQQTGRAALMDMRHLLGVLRESPDDPGRHPQPGIGDLEALVARVQATGLHVRFDVEGSPRPLPGGVGLFVYRIVQEALTNTMRHAMADTVDVRLRYSSSGIEVGVTDDGTGTAAQHPGGRGLAGIRERVALLGGDVEAGQLPSGGFRVRARLPIDREAGVEP